MPTPDLQLRFRLTPGHYLLALLAVEGLLFLSQWFRWLPKGWPVLIAVASVGVVVLGMFVWFGVAVVLRLRFQFSIRSLLVLTVVVAVPCSWLAVEMKKAREQMDAVEVSEGLGEFVIYDWQGVDANGLPSFDDQPPGAACLRTLLGDDFFDEVAIVYVPAGAKAEATNAGLKHIESLPQIKTLSLSDTEVTDAGLEHLKRLTRLKELDLNRTQVTDAGLERLKHLSKLQVLGLKETQVTAAGVAKLQKALPNCKITR